MVTWRAAVAGAAARLGEVSPIAVREARWIGERASGWSGAEWPPHLDDDVTERALAWFDAMVERRCGGEPLQYVLGVWAFRRLELLVDRRVLIPRPETEVLVGVALALAREELGNPDRRPLVVVDLGTGSGAIALSMASELSLGSVEVWATDASEAALDVARANLAGIGRAATHVRMVGGSWFDALPVPLRGFVDLVVSNPPYVSEEEAASLPAEVADWEPRQALVSGPTGLEAMATIVAGAADWLAPGGALVLEVGDRQWRAVTELALDAGFTDVATHLDLAGRDRVVVAR